MANLYVFHQRNAINNAVWHGDSLTYGQNGSNPGTTSATRLAMAGYKFWPSGTYYYPDDLGTGIGCEWALRQHQAK